MFTFLCLFFSCEVNKYDLVRRIPYTNSHAHTHTHKKWTRAHIVTILPSSPLSGSRPRPPSQSFLSFKWCFCCQKGFVSDQPDTYITFSLDPSRMPHARSYFFFLFFCLFVVVGCHLFCCVMGSGMSETKNKNKTILNGLKWEEGLRDHGGRS